VRACVCKEITARQQNKVNVLSDEKKLFFTTIPPMDVNVFVDAGKTRIEQTTQDNDVHELSSKMGTHLVIAMTLELGFGFE